MMSRVHTLDRLAVDVRHLSLGPLDNNVYFISDGDATFVVDPSCEPELLLDVLGDTPLDAIVLTHSHYDHVGAAAALAEATGASVIASAVDAPEIEHPSDPDDIDKAVPCKVDRTVVEGDTVEIGNMCWDVIATPGHTKGSISLYLDPHFGNHPQGRPVLIAGDTLFAGTVGRTDFLGGSMNDMRTSIKKLSGLPDDTFVLTGHNDLTTIGDERGRVFARFGV